MEERQVAQECSRALRLLNNNMDKMRAKGESEGLKNISITVKVLLDDAGHALPRDRSKEIEAPPLQSIEQKVLDWYQKNGSNTEIDLDGFAPSYTTTYEIKRAAKPSDSNRRMKPELDIDLNLEAESSAKLTVEPSDILEEGEAGPRSPLQDVSSLSKAAPRPVLLLSPPDDELPDINLSLKKRATFRHAKMSNIVMEPGEDSDESTKALSTGSSTPQGSRRKGSVFGAIWNKYLKYNLECRAKTITKINQTLNIHHPDFDPKGTRFLNQQSRRT